MLFQQTPPPDLTEWRAGVLPFSLPFSAEPAPPDFARLVQQTLADSVYIEGVAWDDAKLTEAQRVAVAAACARSRDLDGVVVGRIESLFRRTNGGLTVKVELRVVAADTARCCGTGRSRRSGRSGHRSTIVFVHSPRRSRPTSNPASQKPGS